jgi:hypothetical protein
LQVAVPDTRFFESELSRGATPNEGWKAGHGMNRTGVLSRENLKQDDHQ